MINKKAVEALSDLLYVTQLSLELHEFDVEKAYTWMITPTDLLFNRKPFEVAITDAGPLIESLEERLDENAILNVVNRIL